MNIKIPKHITALLQQSLINEVQKDQGNFHPHSILITDNGDERSPGRESSMLPSAKMSSCSLRSDTVAICDHRKSPPSLTTTVASCCTTLHLLQLRFQLLDRSVRCFKVLVETVTLANQLLLP